MWVKLDDGFDQHPKIAQVGPLGIALWTVGLAYCNRQLSDGFIPWAHARSLLSWEFLGPKREDGTQRINQIAVTCGMGGEDVTCAYVIDLLVEAGLWEAVDGGYQIHDYDQYQPTREQVEERERAARSAQRRAKDARRARLAGAPRIERIDRESIIMRDGSRCYLCGSDLPRQAITLDHVIPLARGGAHAEDNLRVACRPCNSRKGAR